MANGLLQNKMVIAAGVAAAAFLVAQSLLKQKTDTVVASANYAIANAYEATTTAAAETNVDALKNKLMQYIYAGALNPSMVLSNIEAIKKEVLVYQPKLTLIAEERVAGRITSGIVSYYLKTIAEEILNKLKIEIKPAPGGGGGEIGIEPWLQNPWGGYVPGEGWYTPPGYGGGGWGGGDYEDYLEQLKEYQERMQKYTEQYQQYGYPNYGYSYGYGYQQPYIAPQTPTQLYNYYPQYQYPGQQYAYPNQQYVNPYSGFMPGAPGQGGTSWQMYHQPGGYQQTGYAVQPGYMPGYMY